MIFFVCVNCENGENIQETVLKLVPGSGVSEKH